MDARHSRSADCTKNHQDQAAAHLQHYFHQQVAEAMPAAFDALMRDPFTLSRFLVNHSMHIKPAQLPVLAGNDPAFFASLSAPTLLVLLFDKRQPADVLVCARDALAEKYLADDDTQALVIGAASRKARQAVQDLELQQAEHKALFGRIVAGGRAIETAEG